MPPSQMPPHLHETGMPHMPRPVQNEHVFVPSRRLGRLPLQKKQQALWFSDFFKPRPAQGTPPIATNFWTSRPSFPPETWGNDRFGCCTIAKQANMFRRFERLERDTTISIATETVLGVYFALTQAKYGGGDTGAVESDALDCSRHRETCLHDSDGHPLLIDAYMSVNPQNQEEFKRAMATAAGHGLAICIALPAAFQSIRSPKVWDIPEGQPLTGDWMPGSWGGHSMWSVDYDTTGPILEHTWGEPPQHISWEAAAAYIDECHIVVDSVDAWLNRNAPLDLHGLVDAVNTISSAKLQHPKLSYRRSAA